MSAPAAVFQYYEELRDYALGRRTALVMPLGIDLFMKRGMMAWMAAWAEFRTHKTAGSQSDKAITGSIEPAIPQTIQPEITMLLANIILSRGGVS